MQAGDTMHWTSDHPNLARGFTICGTDTGPPPPPAPPSSPPSPPREPSSGETGSGDVSPGTTGDFGSGGSDADKEAHWYVSREFRLVLLRNLTQAAPGAVIDFTRYADA